MNLNDFKEEILNYPPGKIVFVGLGNDYRGDDAAGLLFLNRLKELSFLSGATFIKANTNPENHLREIAAPNPKLVVFIDAAQTGRNPGDIFWIDPEELNSVNISTHSFSIKMIEDFLRAGQEMNFKYLGIEPLKTSLGQSISREVIQRIDKFFEE